MMADARRQQKSRLLQQTEPTGSTRSELHQQSSAQLSALLFLRSTVASREKPWCSSQSSI